jgi:hypothetical protein
MSVTDRPHSQYEHVYVIVRVDLPVVDDASPENSIAVVKVLSSKEAADREVARLNEVNGGKGCKYVNFVSRLIPS